MFKKRELSKENLKIGEVKMGEEKGEDLKMDNYEKNTLEPVKEQKPNVIVKGSKLLGDINVTYDLELGGEVEGNITSEERSNIVIKGNCKGSITTKGGNVIIEGKMSKGDIIAGGDIKISGKFNGGRVEAKGKIYLDGEFSGKLESNAIEIGPDAHGKGEIFYKEFISIAKGAKIEGNINQLPSDQKDIKKIPQKINDKNDKKVVSLDPVQRLIKAN